MTAMFQIVILTAKIARDDITQSGEYIYEHVYNSTHRHDSMQSRARWEPFAFTTNIHNTCYK